MYIFLITRPGERTQAKVENMQMFDLNGLIKYVKDNCFLKNKGWHDPMIRVGKINNNQFGVKSTKQLSLEEFEEIFPIEICKDYLLTYFPDEKYSVSKRYPIFKKEIYLKWGIPKKWVL